MELDVLLNVAHNGSIMDMEHTHAENKRTNDYSRHQIGSTVGYWKVITEQVTTQRNIIVHLS